MPVQGHISDTRSYWYHPPRACLCCARSAHSPARTTRGGRRLCSEVVTSAVRGGVIETSHSRRAVVTLLALARCGRGLSYTASFQRDRSFAAAACLPRAQANSPRPSTVSRRNPPRMTAPVEPPSSQLEPRRGYVQLPVKQSDTRLPVNKTNSQRCFCLNRFRTESLVLTRLHVTRLSDVRGRLYCYYIDDEGTACSLHQPSAFCVRTFQESVYAVICM
jgi:hypothetical protein